MADWQPSEAQRERYAVMRRMRRRSMLLSSASAIVVFGATAFALVSSPGWPVVQATFFDWSAAKESFPDVVEGFWLNVRLFVLAEPLILVLGLLVAAVRVSVSPLLTPLRVVA